MGGFLVAGKNNRPIQKDFTNIMTAVKRIFSGIQPTGVPHIGNYFGALKNWISLQNEKDTDHVLFSIVDMHSLTIPKDPKIFKENIKKTAISLLALGLDPEKCILFQQSKVRLGTCHSYVYCINCLLFSSFQFMISSSTSKN